MQDQDSKVEYKSISVGTSSQSFLKAPKKELVVGNAEMCIKMLKERETVLGKAYGEFFFEYAAFLMKTNTDTQRESLTMKCLNLTSQLNELSSDIVVFLGRNDLYGSEKTMVKNIVHTCESRCSTLISSVQTLNPPAKSENVVAASAAVVS